MTHPGARRALVVAALATTLAASGCGSQLDEDHAREVLQSFRSVYKDPARPADDPGLKAMCDQLVRENVAYAVIGEASFPNMSPKKARERAAGQGCGHLLSILLNQFPDATTVMRSPVIDVDVKGENAIVHTEAADWKLEEIDGEWRISNLDPLLTIVKAG